MSKENSDDPYNPNKLVGSIGKSLEGSFAKGPAVDNRLAYVPISATTQSGINSITNAANQPNGLGAAQSWNTGLINSGGLTSPMQGNINDVNGIAAQFGRLASSLNAPSEAANGLGGIANQFGGIANGLSGPSAAQTGYTGLYNRAGSPSLTESELMGTARGDNLNGANPYFEDVLSRSINDTSTGAQAAYGATGRYGSNVASEGIASAIGDVSSRARMQQYETERDRQMQALSAIEGQRQQGFSNQFNSLGASDAARLSQLGARTGALNSQGGMLSTADAARLNQIGAQSGALTNQLGAAGTGFGMGQQGISNASSAAGNAGAIFQNTLMPGQALTAAGGLQDANSNALRAAEMEKFSRKNNAERDWALSYLNGVGGMGAQQPEEVPWWQQILGLGGNLAGNALSGGAFS